MPVVLGAIADDFTGATDLANTLVRQGMHALQTIGVPAEGELDLGDAEAVVVALKSRTSPVEGAISDSLQALRWLQGLGAQQFFFKYCSTFDSTRKGNIGPVADALIDALDVEHALICPAFPANGRSVYQGYLFVHDQLLSDSPMKDHPLTPMHDSSLVRLMLAQSKYPVGLIPLDRVRAGVSAIGHEIDRLRRQGLRYGVVDAIEDEDLITIGRAAASHSLITGGSGVALGLPDNFRRAGLVGKAAAPRVPDIPGRSVVLAGSCSKATREQIEVVKDDWPLRKLDIHRIAAGEPVVDDVLAWAAQQSSELPLLVYGSADPEEVASVQQRYGREAAGQMMEQAMGRTAKGLVTAGARRLIVAGGETAGAVLSALGIRALRIGVEIDPGVPWTESIGGIPLALALKSGNFGSRQFFRAAFGMLPG